MASQQAKDEGEAPKRNTDCVYFLASPLTCKKGTDCEYRHSESARINPRDCWYWINGNCLNLQCPFRHPPLDGRPATSSAPRVSSVAPVTQAKRTPCFFFSQGFCARGDKCYYMHGLQPAPASEAASQKPQNPVAIKSADSTDKQASGSKGSGYKPVAETIQETQNSTEIKHTAQNDAHTQVADLQSILSTQGIVSGQNHDMKLRAAEESASSEPARPNHQKLPIGEHRNFSITEEMTFHVQIGEERARQMSSVEDRIKQVPSEIQTLDDKLQQAHSGEERMQNGVESEDWLEESSTGFDVLVDAGPSQLIYPDDTDYLHHHDVLMEPHTRGRLMHSDDMGEFGYDHSLVYNQSGYYDTPGQFDLDSYDPYDQQQGYEHLCNHLTSEQHILYNEDAMPARDRHRSVPEEGIRSNGCDDLRNWITKRRRLDGRIQPRFADNHCDRLRRDTSASDYQHGHGYQDSYFRRQDMQHHLQIQDDAEPYYRSSHTRHDFGGQKHSYEHGNLSDYVGSPEGISFKISPNKHNLRDHVRAKSRERDREWLVSKVSAGSSEIRGYVASSYRKNETRKDESNFAGPKSLAQIKAEKRRASCQESIQGKNVINEDSSSLISVLPGNARQPVPLKSQISLIPGSSLNEDLGRETKVNGGKVVSVSESFKKGLDFEGPKPFHAVLEAKRKADPWQKLEGGKEKRFSDRFFNEPDKGVNPSFYVNPGSSCQKGLHRTEHDQNHNTSYLQHGNGTKLQQLQYPLLNAEDTTSRKDSAEEGVEMQDKRSSDRKTELGPGIDMVMGTQCGDNDLEDEYLGLDADDDDDDFAKKLGGLFS